MAYFRWCGCVGMCVCECDNQPEVGYQFLSISQYYFFYTQTHTQTFYSSIAYNLHKLTLTHSQWGQWPHRVSLLYMFRMILLFGKSVRRKFNSVRNWKWCAADGSMEWTSEWERERERNCTFTFNCKIGHSYKRIQSSAFTHLSQLTQIYF